MHLAAWRGAVPLQLLFVGGYVIEVVLILNLINLLLEISVVSVYYVMNNHLFNFGAILCIGERVPPTDIRAYSCLLQDCAKSCSTASDHHTQRRFDPGCPGGQNGSFEQRVGSTLIHK